MGFYKRIVRPLLFARDPEKAHDTTVRLAEFAGRARWLRAMVNRRYAAADPVLRTTAAGLELNSPIGLSAGFDKNARAMSMTAHLGFGFLEIGSATLRPWTGNAGCRMARMTPARAIWSRYGLPNDGIGVIAGRLGSYASEIPIGLSIAAVHENRPEFDTNMAIREFAAAFAQAGGVADYAVVNLACPNCDGHDLFKRLEDIDRLLSAVESSAAPGLPLFVKLADRNESAWTGEFIKMLEGHGSIAGVIPIPIIMQDRGFGSGTLTGTVTGLPLWPMTSAIVRRWASSIDPERHVLIASGGVSSAAQAYSAIRSGASLVQVFTALAFDGPGLVKRLNGELAALLVRDGFAGVGEAVGADVGWRAKAARCA